MYARASYSVDGMGYEAGVHPSRLGDKQAEPISEKEVYARASLQGGSQTRSVPTQSEVERALVEQSEQIERLAGVISGLLARLSPVLMDCPPSPDKDARTACQPFSTEIARAIDARSSNLAVLTDELRSAASRLGI